MFGVVLKSKSSANGKGLKTFADSTHSMNRQEVNDISDQTRSASEKTVHGQRANDESGLDPDETDEREDHEIGPNSDDEYLNECDNPQLNGAVVLAQQKLTSNEELDSAVNSVQQQNQNGNSSASDGAPVQPVKRTSHKHELDLKAREEAGCKFFYYPKFLAQLKAHPLTEKPTGAEWKIFIDKMVELVQKQKKQLTACEYEGVAVVMMTEYEFLTEADFSGCVSFESKLLDLVRSTDSADKLNLLNSLN